ncbi:MAG TPA: hypothetical protein VMM84_17515 [Pyrinomonadaceae bacterium]|nr:hypothetical protein [Pyrinomonadaceae bacterium]
MKKLSFQALALVSVLAVLLMSAERLAAQIVVDPNGVNVNAQGSTVIFLTFGGLLNQFPGEGCWCGQVVPAAPDIGFRCNPATIFGCLPARFDLSRTSGTRGFTDIMSIPPSVSRRAYQAAASGDTSSFFYVRRFISTVGGPDVFVPVTCRMTGGGARTPFALTDVKLSFAIDKPVLLTRTGGRVPPIKAEIAYNGTGRLKGRWEVVMPGDDLPTTTDLLTESSLPIEERGKQLRYKQVETFNIFLPPAGRYVLNGPDPARLPNEVNGQYLVLLRIETADDKEGDSNLAIAGAGPGVVHSGAVAGFPLPVLRYFVGAGPETQLAGPIALLSPGDKSVLSTKDVIELTWADTTQPALYRLEIENLKNEQILSAILLPNKRSYRAPPWIGSKAEGGYLRWRVIALDREGKTQSESPWRDLRVQPESQVP